MQGDDLVRSVHRGRRVELIRQLFLSGPGAGLVCGWLTQLTAMKCTSTRVGADFLSTSQPSHVHDVVADQRFKMMAERSHSEYCLEALIISLPTSCFSHYEHHGGAALLLLVLPNALSWTPSHGYHPKHLPSMHEQRSESAKEARKRKTKGKTEKKMVETLPIGLRVLHVNIKCSFRRGIMVKIAFQNNPAKEMTGAKGSMLVAIPNQINLSASEQRKKRRPSNNSVVKVRRS